MAVQANQIFVNLPVKDLSKTIAFFTQIGFEFNPQFTDDNATCMIISEHIFAMLLVEDYFKTFIKKEIVDASKSTEVIVALAVDNREEVDAIVQRALDAGAATYNDPMDHGFMYQRSFQDINGHLWEIFHMDPSAINQG